MGNVVFQFSGQGAQYAGMGRELYERSPAARAVFDSAELIRPGTIQQCFSGSDEELARTENTQPCLYCVDLAAAAALNEAGVQADMLAGFSLGELAALAFSGAVSFENGFRMVCKRAELMQRESEGAGAGMAAVLKLTDSQVTALCAEFSNVYPVNFNCEGQVVVAGDKDELKPFMRRIKEAGGKAIPLKVGGGFHSMFMSGAADNFAEALDGFEIGDPQLPLYSNVTGRPYDSEAKQLLTRHICSPVLWREEVENMITDGADTFIEVGSGKTLSGLVARISENVRVFNVEDFESLNKTIEGVMANAGESGSAGDGCVARDRQGSGAETRVARCICGDRGCRECRHVRRAVRAGAEVGRARGSVSV